MQANIFCGKKCIPFLFFCHSLENYFMLASAKESTSRKQTVVRCYFFTDFSRGWFYISFYRLLTQRILPCSRSSQNREPNGKFKT